MYQIDCAKAPLFVTNNGKVVKANPTVVLEDVPLSHNAPEDHLHLTAQGGLLYTHRMMTQFLATHDAYIVKQNALTQIVEHVCQAEEGSCNHYSPSTGHMFNLSVLSPLYAPLKFLTSIGVEVLIKAGNVCSLLIACYVIIKLTISCVQIVLLSTAGVKPQTAARQVLMPAMPVPMSPRVEEPIERTYVPPAPRYIARELR